MASILLLPNQNPCLNHTLFLVLSVNNFLINKLNTGKTSIHIDHPSTTTSTKTSPFPLISGRNPITALLGLESASAICIASFLFRSTVDLCLAFPLSRRSPFGDPQLFLPSTLVTQLPNLFTASHKLLLLSSKGLVSSALACVAGVLVTKNLVMIDAVVEGQSIKLRLINSCMNVCAFSIAQIYCVSVPKASSGS